MACPKILQVGTAYRTYIYLGRENEARAEAAEVLRINPKFSVEQYGKNIPVPCPAYNDRWKKALLKAGLK